MVSLSSLGQYFPPCPRWLTEDDGNTLGDKYEIRGKLKGGKEGSDKRKQRLKKDTTLTKSL